MAKVQIKSEILTSFWDFFYFCCLSAMMDVEQKGCISVLHCHVSNAIDSFQYICGWLPFGFRKEKEGKG